MKIITLATSSKGNSYILQVNNGKFCILDCGIKFEDITSSKCFSSFSKLDFVFTSHEHLDHSKSLTEFEKSGCDTISYKNIGDKKRIEINDWIICPFKVKHNVLNYGAIIYNKTENKKIVYATDFIEMPKIQNVDYWLYEVNYDEFTVDKIIDSQDISKIHVANNIQYHNSLENAVEYFKSLNNRPKLIIACHTSEMGGTKKLIKQKLSKLCDKVEIATKNQVVEF